MKLNELKCDSCEKNKKIILNSEEKPVLDQENGIGGEETIENGNSNSCSSSPLNKTDNEMSIVAKCFDCNYYLCSNCLLDHQLTKAYSSHQLISLNNLGNLKEPAVMQQQQPNPIGNNNFKMASSNSSLHISNLAQLQMQYNSLEDQILIKRRQQQQQQQQQQAFSFQQLQSTRLAQIESEIQKTYNFYTQMLNERRDYLINELNTIVKYAILNHNQNFAKQLKLKQELDQKRQSLEIAEAVASAIAASNEQANKISPDSKYDNDNYHDNNNNKISNSLIELNNMSLLNNQILMQLRASNPLNSIEFVSNFSAIQTSIRNTFGYIRINNHLNSGSNSNVNSGSIAYNSNNGVYDYLSSNSIGNANNNNRTPQQQSELNVMCDMESTSSASSMSSGSSMSSTSTQNGINNKQGISSNNNCAGSVSDLSNSDYLNQTTNHLLNSFTAASVATATSGNNNKSDLGQKQQQQQKQTCTSSLTQNSISDFSSPISGSSNQHSENLITSNNGGNSSASYLIDHLVNTLGQSGNKDCSNLSGSGSAFNQLINLNKQTAEEMFNENGQFFSNTTNSNDSLLNSNFGSAKPNANSKASWPSLMNATEDSRDNNNNKPTGGVFDEFQSNNSLVYSPFMLNQVDQNLITSNEQQNMSPNSLDSFINQKQIGINSLALSVGSNNSMSAAVAYLSKLSNTNATGLQDQQLSQMILNAAAKANGFNAQQQQQFSSSTSTLSSATSEEQLLSPSSSSLSSTSEINYQDQVGVNLASSLTAFKSAGFHNSNEYLSNSGLSNSSSNTCVMGSGGSGNGNGSSSTRSQLRRSKMIYHCKFGEFGVNDGQFTEPSGVTINPNNDIIVADTNSHRIQIFDKDGRFKFKFGECGKRDGQLLYPNRVSVVKHTGDIVVTERSPTHQIQIYNKYGQFLRKFGANILQHPRGVCVDSKGRIIVVECKVMRVLIFDLMGNVLQKFNCAKYLEFPNGVCCSSTSEREEIYISDNRAHCIKVFDYNGNFIRQIGGEGITNYPIGVGINSNNEILVADNHNNFNLTVFTQDGQLISALESKVKHAQCFDVGLMDDGSIVLASKDYRIYVYKYVNNNGNASLNLSNSIGIDQHYLSNENEFNLAGGEDLLLSNTIGDDQPLYDLFSPQMRDLSSYNQLCGLASESSLENGKNENNFFDTLSTLNCLI